MARTTRALQNQAPTPAEIAANNPPLNSTMTVTRAKRKTLDELAPAEVALAKRIETMREQRRGINDPKNATYISLGNEMRNLTNDLNKMRALRVGQPRIDGIFNAIRLLGNLADGQYKLPQEVVGPNGDLWIAISEELATVKRKFQESREAEKPGFSLARYSSNG